MGNRLLGLTCAALSLAAGCRGRGGVALDPLPPANFRPVARPAAPDAVPLLEHSNLPARVRALGDRPLDAWAEAGAVVVYGEHGGVWVLDEEGDETAVTALPRLPAGCRPTDAATDLQGNVCVQTACGLGAACARASSEAWAPAALLNDAEGLASAPGAVVAWWSVGQGTVRADAAGHVASDPRPPGWEIVASADGGRSWGSVATLAGRDALRAVLLRGPHEGVYVTEARGALQVHEALPRAGTAAEPSATVVPAPRSEASFGRVLAANGLVAALSMRGSGMEVSQGFPASRFVALPQFVALGSAAVCAWDDDTVVAANGRDLITVRLAHGRWQRWGNWISLPPVPDPAHPDRPAAVPPLPGEPIACGRAGRSLAVILADGTTLFYRPASPPPPT